MTSKIMAVLRDCRHVSFFLAVRGIVFPGRDWAEEHKPCCDLVSQIVMMKGRFQKHVGLCRQTQTLRPLMEAKTFGPASTKLWVLELLHVRRKKENEGREKGTEIKKNNYDDYGDDEDVMMMH